MKHRNALEPLLPEIYLRQLRPMDWEGLEEIRIGAGRPLRLRYGRAEREIWPAATGNVVEEILQRSCHHSAYAFSETIRQGYVTVEGGHRIGICGFGVIRDGAVQTLRLPSSLNIRVAHAVLGCADSLAPVLTVSTLLLGPPGSGKTTLLRDAVRQLSDLKGEIIGIADERGELSACLDGMLQSELGSRSDVLVNVPKAAAVMMLLRTMSPQWIALDEITAPEDIVAIEQAAYCGVNILATAHGESLQDLYGRPLYKRLMETGVFRQVVVLNRDKSYSIQEVSI